MPEITLTYTAQDLFHLVQRTTQTGQNLNHKQYRASACTGIQTDISRTPNSTIVTSRVIIDLSYLIGNGDEFFNPEVINDVARPIMSTINKQYLHGVLSSDIALPCPFSFNQVSYNLEEKHDPEVDFIQQVTLKLRSHLRAAQTSDPSRLLQSLQDHYHILQIIVDYIEPQHYEIDRFIIGPTTSR